ncbi:hypothetical protein JCM10207_006842 [Rhodosporidiobolus poonsookiae]
MPHDKTYGGAPDYPAVAQGTYRPFPTPFDQIESEDGWTDQSPDYFEAPYTLQEIDMLALSYSIRSKPGWATKMRDPAIREKWKKEALEHRSEMGIASAGEDPGEDDKPRARLTEGMVEYVLKELEMHEKELEDENGIRLSCFDKVYESDTLIPSSLRASLLAHVAQLEANPPHGTPDWHPGSNNQVLDLVHPSLYPLRYGVTPVRALDDEGKVTDRVEAPEPRNAIHSASKKYQWLPSDFDVDAEGKVSITSYINNLHPVDHAPFYPVLSSLFERFLPMFERVLSSLQAPTPRRIYIDSEVTSRWYGDGEYEGDEDAEDYWERYEEYEENKTLRLPEPGEFRMPSAEEIEKKKEEGPAFPLKGRKLQVIVKLANIHLTPEQPTYEGGVWHVEGMQNEEIVASGIYYFDQENITDSQLAFRGTFDDDQLPYEQSDDRGVRAVFGIENDSPCIQYFNALDTKAGRAICFPNIYQHKVSSFSLEDKSKPGFRKILVFFLVDPLKSASGTVISTSRVPYQQRGWAERELPSSVRSRLPDELWIQSFDQTDGLMDLDEAKRVREELMHERKFLVKENSEKVFERSFSLCEH